ncbi:PREDICTED: potassium/sodium hyperpolarization-activated cyclic nucleotide-gated channel 1-like [Vollenhovia emeryi]|uniref:potassium/sodium hyperpolarization-activated cyclic nucleotide-gated channel 1-like n=1 Tax=Vollenhovia emeryi TaxID=411798 RepID=UPI0005F3BCDE|nr:PREDICTED: potassium/sodium hyperpolarization-activated cyclic nucleotide-gated channel 1-like [Vollenhovia emeryi]
MIEHICELSLKRESKFPFGGIKPLTFRNVWTTWCGISKRTPKCYLYMDSMAAISAEKIRHAESKYWWIIHPFSYARHVLNKTEIIYKTLQIMTLPYVRQKHTVLSLNEKIRRLIWDILMMAVYTIAFFTIPFVICFVIMDYESIRVDTVNFPIYVMCWVDIILNCVTGYYDKKTMSIELKPSKIFTSYLKGFLVPDIISSFPYNYVTLQWRRLPGNNPRYIVTLINLLPLFKLTRYYTYNLNIHYLFTHFQIKNFYWELCTTTLLLGLYLIFWFSCLCYLIPILLMYFMNIPPTECGDCWMMKLEDNSFIFKFKNAAFIVLENILASGYGPFVPETNGSIIFNSILMIIGRFIVCYILVMFLRIKAERKSSESKFHELIDQVKAYTRQKQLLPHMEKRLLAYYHCRFKNTYFRSKRILSDLTEPLREEIALQSCRRLIESVAIFKNLPRNVLQSIVKNLKFELYLPNDVIIKAGSQGDCMFFLSFGTVAVLTPTGKEVSSSNIQYRVYLECEKEILTLCYFEICHLDNGAHFGEIALLVADQRRVASVVAIDVCEVYRLDRKDFRQCIDVHSELFAEIERIATERIERTVRVEEQHKRFLMRPNRMPKSRNEPTKN